ncbi:chromosome partitioning protein ParA [Photobacterium profundum]|uniref:CobQ/CobB/MinD/ParA nucleotide binding domain-containing protein n=1 Tax=Photobacterium profundum 3TCK TaxID=314280 RepID=Q1Z419_9GAMM|nr:P-loop NTPase [Photobacterium profundum]EAS43283.1 hypothetical protein P3TCK_27794 [Photobacterium profundum 3TCK]PSV61419.1 chromosome partitioning protein ParA [Photobacterium profundum]
MFDLAKAISQTTEKSREHQGPTGCTLFYQTDACLNLVQEVFRFEGWQAPDCLKNQSQSTDYSSKKSNKLEHSTLQEIIILELNQSTNVVDDAKSFASRLPNHKGVVVIGQEDAITTLRGLKEMGFYYLFWPANKQEITDFLRHVHSNQQRFAGVSQNRKAKRVAVLGSKGGVGNTVISAELAACLAHSGAETILIDHQYAFSNIDIVLGLKQFQKQDANNLALQLHDMDEATASDYLIKVTDHLRLLAIEGNEPTSTLQSYTDSINDLLMRQANFIIEDFSGSVDFSLNLHQLVERHDVMIIVVEPTVSSVRSARFRIEQIEEISLTHSLDIRVLTFMNVHRPDVAFSLTREEVSTYLGRVVDVTLQYDKRFASLLLDGKRLHKLEKSAAGPFNDMALLLHGKTLCNHRSSMAKLRGLFKR